MSSQFLEILPLKLSILRLGPHDEVPTRIYKSKFYTISKSEKELSIVAETSILSKYCENPIVWRPIRFKEVLDFSMTGIMAKISAVLAEAKISILAISTFETDYVLVRKEDLKRAVEVLTEHYSIFRL